MLVFFDRAYRGAKGANSFHTLKKFFPYQAVNPHVSGSKSPRYVTTKNVLLNKKNTFVAH